jgi:parallel beta-helix repeat protein
LISRELWGIDLKNVNKGTLLMLVSAALTVSILTSSGGSGIVQADGAISPTLTISPTIRVNNDTELASLISSNYWNGSGTTLNPYCIQNLDFDISDYGVAIYIGNTTSYLIVSNCSNGVNNSHLSGMSGITLFNVMNALLENNYFHDLHYQAIDLEYSSNDTVSKNRCVGNTLGGIYILNSSHNIVSDNNCSGNGGGVILYSSSNNTLSYNTCTQNADGMDVIYSNNNIVSDNNCSDNPEGGIHLLGSIGNTVSNNNCSNAGIISERSSNNLLGNSGTVPISSDGSDVKDNSWLLFPIIIVLMAIMTVLIIKGRKKGT